VTLPDLRTRLAITPVAVIEQPDDALFASLIRRLFADRGLHLRDDALRYACERVTRDYWTAERVVEAIDRFAIASSARLTLPTVRRALIAGGLIDGGQEE
jgi:chromosomal replication initiation ATPase DnaA